MIMTTTTTTTTRSENSHQNETMSRIPPPPFAISILSPDRKELAEIMAMEMVLYSKKSLNWDRMCQQVTNPTLLERIQQKRTYTSFSGSAMNLLVGKGEQRSVFMKYRAWLIQHEYTTVQVVKTKAVAAIPIHQLSHNLFLTPFNHKNKLYSWKAHYQHLIAKFLEQKAVRYETLSEHIINQVKSVTQQQQQQQQQQQKNTSASMSCISAVLIDAFIEEQDDVYSLHAACHDSLTNRSNSHNEIMTSAQTLDFFIEQLQAETKTFLTMRLQQLFHAFLKSNPKSNNDDIWGNVLKQYSDFWGLHYRTLETILDFHMEGVEEQGI